jgi:hypothetical protein
MSDEYQYGSLAAGIATLGAIGAPLLGVPKLSDAAALTKDIATGLRPIKSSR